MKRRLFKISLLTLGALTCTLMSPSCSNSEHHDADDGHGHDEHVEDPSHKGHVDGEHEGEEEHEHEKHDHSGLIKLDGHKAKEFGVETEKIDPSDFSEVILVSGRIESKATDESVATATRSGILTLAPDINTGVRVGAGKAIGSIRTTTVQSGDPSVQAIAARDAAKRELDRIAPLHKDGIVSTQVYNNALAAYEQAEAALKSAKQGSASISSPKAGVITRLLASTGEYVEAGQKVAVISGNTNLTLRADVPEKYGLHLSNIETANFQPSSSSETYSLADLGGRIISNPGAAVAENGYIPLYFSFDNNGAIAPGAFAEVYLMSGARHGVIAVPKEALVEINGNKCLYTRHGEGLYEKHVVTVGANDGRRVEILSGLKGGEDVVTKGAQIVRMAETSATAVPGHTHNH